MEDAIPGRPGKVLRSPTTGYSARRGPWGPFPDPSAAVPLDATAGPAILGPASLSTSVLRAQPLRCFDRPAGGSAAAAVPPHDICSAGTTGEEWGPTMPIVRQNEPISAWEEGDFVQGYSLVSRKDVRHDRNGREYFDLELCDATGQIPAKIWPDSPAIQSRFAEKSFVHFKGTVRAYRDQLQLNLDHCRTVTEADKGKGFDEALLVPSTPEDIDALWRRLEAIYPGAIERPEMRRLTEEAQRRFGQQLKVHPAAKSIHHAYRGGLLEHVVKMAELALSISEHYPEDLDRDLLLLGIYFHDLGKIRELGAMPNNDYTLEGQLVGHIVIGMGLLRECVAAIEGFPETARLQLEHLVVSHHGRREYGSPIEPSIPEAFALNLIDDLDSKLNQLRGHRRSGIEGLHFIRALGRSVYFDPDRG